jgi:hypothetical protein
MNTIKVTPLEKKVLEVLALEMYAEVGFSDAGLGEVCKGTGLSPNIVRGVQSSLIKKGLIDVDDRKDSWDVNHLDPYTHIWYLQTPVMGLVEHWIGQEVFRGSVVDPVQLITE